MRISKFLIAVIFAFSAIGCQEPEAPVSAEQKNEGPTEMERVKAEAGVGKEGQIIGDKEGFLRTPAKALFTAKQKIAFMKVEHAVNLYDGFEGHKPKTHEAISYTHLTLPTKA